MANKVIKWRNSKGDPVSDEVTVSPGNSSGNTKETISSSPNIGIDREVRISISSSENSSIKKEVSITQEGLRQPFSASDGKFLDKGGYVYGVLKPIR